MASSISKLHGRTLLQGWGDNRENGGSSSSDVDLDLDGGTTGMVAFNVDASSCEAEAAAAAAAAAAAQRTRLASERRLRRKRKPTPSRSMGSGRLQRPHVLAALDVNSTVAETRMMMDSAEHMTDSEVELALSESAAAATAGTGRAAMTVSMWLSLRRAAAAVAAAAAATTTATAVQEGDSASPADCGGPAAKGQEIPRGCAAGHVAMPWTTDHRSSSDDLDRRRPRSAGSGLGSCDKATHAATINAATAAAAAAAHDGGGDDDGDAAGLVRTICGGGSVRVRGDARRQRALARLATLDRFRSQQRAVAAIAAAAAGTAAASRSTPSSPPPLRPLSPPLPPSSSSMLELAAAACGRPMSVEILAPTEFRLQTA